MVVLECSISQPSTRLCLTERPDGQLNLMCTSEVLCRLTLPSASILHKLRSPFHYLSVEILVSRQKKAGALKKMTDVAVRMSEEQLVELRADIKVNFSPSCYNRALA